MSAHVGRTADSFSPPLQKSECRRQKISPVFLGRLLASAFVQALHALNLTFWFSEAPPITKTPTLQTMQQQVQSELETLQLTSTKTSPCDPGRRNLQMEQYSKGINLRVLIHIFTLCGSIDPTWYWFCVEWFLSTFCTLLCKGS